MKNQKYTPHNGQPVPPTEAIQAEESNKEPSVLDKLKDQIKKIKELKEKGTGRDDHHE